MAGGCSAVGFEAFLVPFTSDSLLIRPLSLPLPALFISNSFCYYFSPLHPSVTVPTHTETTSVPRGSNNPFHNPLILLATALFSLPPTIPLLGTTVFTYSFPFLLSICSFSHCSLPSTHTTPPKLFLQRTHAHHAVNPTVIPVFVHLTSQQHLRQ